MSERPLLGGGDSFNGSGSSQADTEGQDFTPYRTFPPSPSESRDSADSAISTRARVNPKIVSDAILGLSDGLTVPFALSAGLSALGDTKVVVVGGLAELVAGAISMGLGGYVGARSEVEAYEATVRETKHLVRASPVETMNIIREVFAPYNLPDEPVARMSNILHDSPQKLLDFLLTFHHKESKPKCNQAWISAITLALGYFIGGFIPLIPYFLVKHVLVALYYSIGIMGVTLLLFGYVKTCVVRGWAGRDNVVAGIKGGLQMIVVGGLAAGASIALVRAINPTGHGPM
ncbi:hypothetical protein FQN49_005111 [Arthroderma sp. PD_2]|nr:hypothetical protein FQN49_005111 [Arthroderma sp. PD_2]